MKINKKPFFTIGIPTYNRASYLKLAIESVLKQDFKDYEILIVDNHSTDNTESVVKSYYSKYKNIVYIRNVTNNGGAKSLVKIFSKARAKYLFYLCDDDIILKKDTLSGLYKIIQSKKPGFIKLEALFYYKNISNIMKCFKFDHKTKWSAFY
jgi:glycosyltransferase involved in cell wall biosynthesis